MKVFLFVACVLLLACGVNSQVCSPTNVVFDTTFSQLSAPTLRLAFDSNKYFNSTTFTFVGAGVNCNSNVNVSMWSYNDTANPSCVRTFFFNSPLNFALQYCNFVRYEDVKNGTTVTYRTNVIAQTIYPMAALRGVSINVTTQTSMLLDIDFQDIALSTTNVSVQGGGAQGGSSSIYAGISQQSWNYFTSTLTLTLVTSMAWPYQLNVLSINTDPAWSSTAIVAAVPGPNNLAPNNTNYAVAACSDMGAGSLGTTGCTTSDGSYDACRPCYQTWTITLVKINNCPTYTNLTHPAWTLNYSIICNSLYTGACGLSPTDPLSYAQATFDTNSGNICPQLVSANSGSLSASITATNPGGNPIGSFTFGARSNFTIVVTGSIVIQRVIIETITITTGAPTANLLLYNNTITTTAAQQPCNTMFGGSCTTGTFVGGSASAPTFLNIGDTNLPSNTTAKFSLIWTSAISTATTDSPVQTTILVAVRVRYLNQTVVGGRTVMTVQEQVRTLDFTESSSSASIQIGVSATDAPTSAAPTTSDVSAASSVDVTIIAIVAVAVGVLAASVLGVVMVWRKRSSNNQKKGQNSTINLVSMSEVSTTHTA